MTTHQRVLFVSKFIFMALLLAPMAALAMQGERPPRGPQRLSCSQFSTACLSFILIEKGGHDGESDLNYCGLAESTCPADQVARLKADMDRAFALSPAQADDALVKGGISCRGLVCSGQGNTSIDWHSILDEVLGVRNPGQDPIPENDIKIRIAAMMTLHNFEDCVQRLTEGMKPSEARVILPDGFDVNSYCRRQFPLVNGI